MMSNGDLDNNIVLKMNEIIDSLKSVSALWNGMDSITKMKTNGFRHWKQMEWIGFYFEYLCQKHLPSCLKMPGIKYGKVEFDGFGEIPWDFKAHVSNSGSSKVIVNDSEAIGDAIDEYEYVGLILANGRANYNDENQTFKNWHNTLKGGQSNYERKRIKRGAKSRRRKTSFHLDSILLILIDDETLENSGTFQKGFRNADGSARREKVLLDLSELDSEIRIQLSFPVKT